MNLPQLLDSLQTDPSFSENVTRWHVQPARPAHYGGFPTGLDSRLVEALNKRGIPDLYVHQTEAVDTALAGRSTVVVTPTASGKTLCYNLPVLNEILANPAARALYLFPTKALSQDQVAELHEFCEELDVDIRSYVYDGDTPATLRPHIREAGHIVVTNPDMLHTGILPHHTKWVRLFENLKYIVIDELHTYRGVFGSHVANVLRRLSRICAFYGSEPQFLCSSATIANPKQLAERLTGQPVELIDDNGAPQGEKHFVFFNPPVITQDGLREPVLKAGRRIAGQFLRHGVQTIVFARSRLATEVLLTYLQEDMARGARGVTRKRAADIRGYRGGYLPGERRAIERGLRSGDVLGVVSTNALELGIDVGRLDACVMVGYPGTIAATWQQAGRAGRRQGTSVAVLVASNGPLDQYIVQHPDYFFDKSPEHGLINPDNLMILVSHMKCAAFELPFQTGEAFGIDVAGTDEILGYLQDEKIVRYAGGQWHWMSENFPAQDISLRSAGGENFVIVDTSDPQHRVIGEIDRLSAMTMLHTHAIYIHEGQQFLVDKLDWDERRAWVHRVDVDYYTDANLAVTIRVLDSFKEAAEGALEKRFGEVMTACKATIFKKVKLYTHENVGWGEIHLPEEEMHTAACWLSVPPEVADRFRPDELQSALLGTAHLLESLAPVFLMCDPRDLRATVQMRAPHDQRPTIYLYDAYPGGIGLAEKVYDLQAALLQTALEQVLGCACEDGCPACIGPDAGSRLADSSAGADAVGGTDAVGARADDGANEVGGPDVVGAHAADGANEVGAADVVGARADDGANEVGGPDVVGAHAADGANEVGAADVVGARADDGANEVGGAEEVGARADGAADVVGAHAHGGANEVGGAEEVGAHAVSAAADRAVSNGVGESVSGGLGAVANGIGTTPQLGPGADDAGTNLHGGDAVANRDSIAANGPNASGRAATVRFLRMALGLIAAVDEIGTGPHVRSVRAGDTPGSNSHHRDGAPDRPVGDERRDKGRAEGGASGESA